MDLRKAFDTVDINILLSILSLFGISGVKLLWFRSYLTGRSQSAIFDGHLSDPLPVSIGVPKDSILGPLLFLLYRNDLPKIAHNCSVNMYADDTEMEDSCKPEYSIKLETNLNSDLSRLKEYFNLNWLNINVGKCEFMLIGTYQALKKILNINVNINGEPINREWVAKYVGMYIDENLKWDVHFEILKKVSDNWYPHTYVQCYCFTTFRLCWYCTGFCISSQ